MEEPDDGGPYVAGSPLVQLFGSPGRTRIVEAFLGKRGTELTAPEIADLAGIHPSTVSRNVDALVDVGLVERRETASGGRYWVAADDPVVRELVAVRRALLGATADDERRDDGESDRDPTSEAYVDRSGLVRLFASLGRTKMVAAFLGKRGAELTGAEVADLAGVAHSTVSRNVDALVDLGVVERTRRVGISKLYRLDATQPVSERLWNVRRELLSGTGGDRPE